MSPEPFRLALDPADQAIVADALRRYRTAIEAEAAAIDAAGDGGPIGTACRNQQLARIGAILLLLELEAEL